jgi:hypothetical protein
MDTQGAANLKTGKSKDALLAEIFNAYKESGTLYLKTTDPEIRRTMLDLKRCYDLAILHLSPLGVHAEKHWDEMKIPFAGTTGPQGHGQALPGGAGRPLRVED